MSRNKTRDFQNFQDFLSEQEGYLERLPKGTEPFFLLYAQFISHIPGHPQFWKRRTYRRWTFEYTIEGEGILEIDHIAYTVKPGDVYILPIRHDHLYYPVSPDGWKKVYFNSIGCLHEQLLQSYGLVGKYYYPNCGEKVLRLFRKIHDLFYRRETDIHNEAALLFHELIQMLNKSSADMPGKGVYETVLQISHAIERSIFTGLNVKELARRFHLSQEYMTRIFRKHMGCAPYEYYLHRRLLVAREMLASGEFNLSEIAAKLNFNDQFHFSKIFRQKTGMAPSEYRRLQKTGQETDKQENPF